MPLDTVTQANVETLSANIGALGPSDKNFAGNLLIAAQSRRGLSERQAHWVGVLAQRAVTPRPAVVNIGDLAPVIAMFDAAAQRGLNRRAILLDSGAGFALRVTVAGANARAPGSLNVTDRGAFEERRWFGRIDRAGNFQPTTRIAVPDSVYAALRAFAANPTETARLYGQRTGCCMFCSRELTDARSVDMGYGPVCADKWGLPWGETH